jgi:shikimate kinase
MSTAILTMDAPTPTRSLLSPAPAGIDRIVLTGFMGSGKTSLGTLLAERLGWGFVDLDREIERRDGRSVPLIFSQSGEAQFRHLETSALASVLGHRRIVLALGGGAPEELGNRLLLEQTPHTAVVYLSAPYPTLVDRCTRQAAEPDAVERPVLADVAVAAQRFDLRRPHYERIASHTLDTSQLQLEEAVSELLHILPAGRTLQ